MIEEFKKFILRGNAVDLAVGALIGAAFGGIVKSLTDGIIGPLIASVGGQPNVTFKMGPFDLGMVINAVLSFLIIALIIFFFIVKPMNVLLAKMEKKSDASGPPETPADIKLLAEIRDLLKK